MDIDIVFSGGGVKAFAFVGALDVLDQAGYRYKSIAGTSAGSIVAALLSAGYTITEIKDLMKELNTETLLDRKVPIFRFSFVKWLRLYWQMGLYSGSNFEEWITQLLLKKGIRTFGDLEKGSLRVIVSDITQGKMVILPDDLHQYGVDSRMFSVARAVRMSCSLPFLFEPISLFNQNAERCLIIDGGMLSNFPVWLFDQGNEKPARPFLGLQLSQKPDLLPARKIKNGVDLLQGLFQTMQRAHDAKYISKFAASNIIFIPVNHIKTADFDLTNKDRDELFNLGKKQALKFLKKWTY
ncbi:patatin-like phospholipase family protein [Terrilactibacillus laevilacticus]|uniref:Patatin-like phospholipase family protein n=1 Tax=Terrilactibacillus laevilacticus TaxID=1380157 RepID=A0ABW5PUM6_9BACI|nr:patatin-like phospholipase family protein [Terrilactibacillus laevilacticus]